MTELFYWKEMERHTRAAQALAMLRNRRDTDGISQANARLGRAAAWPLTVRAQHTRRVGMLSMDAWAAHCNSSSQANVVPLSLAKTAAQ